MSETDLFDNMFCMSSEKGGYANQEFSRPTGNWCEVLSSINNVNPKQAWKCGTEKLSQTLSNVKNTFGVISQRIRKSTKKRQSLGNLESPRSPVTPYTRSKTVLGRTPTKLYSPFSIDTPTEKENKSNRFVRDENYLLSSNIRSGEKKLLRTKLDLNGADCENNTNIGEEILSKDLLQTQTEIYEFLSVTERIARNDFHN